MKIDKPADKPAPALGTALPARTAVEPGKGAPAPVAQASATVALSSGVTELLSKDQALEGDFDAQKVERIAQAISDGKFEINAPVVADKLLANAREVLGKAQH